MTGLRARTIPSAIAAIVLAVGLWGAFSWSLIPTDVDGRVEAVAHYSDTGLRFRVLELDDGRSVVVDRQIVDAVGAKELKGQSIRSSAWSPTLHVGERSIDLRPSRAFWQVMVALGVLCFLGLRPWWVAEPAPDPGSGASDG